MSILYNLRNSARFQPPKSHFRDSRFQNFPGGACPRITLHGPAPSAFASPSQKNEGLATPLAASRYRSLSLSMSWNGNIFTGTDTFKHAEFESENFPRRKPAVFSQNAILS
jgi:hypothetical protein